MKSDNSEKIGIKEPKGYVSVSTRLPFADAVFLKLICNRSGIAPSEYIRNLIKNNINSPKNNFLSGKNKIKYNKLNNSFSWFVQFDSGEEIEVLSNLSQDFFKNLHNEIQDAIKQRNEWIHQTKKDSIGIPKELVEKKNED